MFQLYRFSDEVYWPEQLHNDWLETRITFGWLGFLMLLAALAGVGRHARQPAVGGAGVAGLGRLPGACAV
jgi:hypothetical protein